MTKAKIDTVDAYLSGQPAASRAALDEVRAIIRKTLPGAVEGVSYGIPTYQLPGGHALYFAGWKRHYALYPVSANIAGRLGDDPTRYHVTNATIRFPFSAPVPAKLIARIARLRARERPVADKPRARRKG